MPPVGNFLPTTVLGNSAAASVRLDVAAKNVVIPQFSHKLANDYAFAMRENWDGDGAKAVSRSVIRLAGRLIEQFGGVEHLVEISPGRDGGISFIWDDERGNYIYLDVGPSDTVHLFHETVGEAKWEAVSVADDPKIISRLQSAFSRLFPQQQVVFRFSRASGAVSQRYVRIA